MKDRLTYRDAGVDIDAKADGIESARADIERTWGKHHVGSFGGFGGLFAMPKGYDDPLLCSSTDGVGTKIAVAIACGKHDTVGHDLVNHCVNDILVQGARPLFLLDYVAMGRVDKTLIRDVIRGFADGCVENGCELSGGETAEMPGTYKEGDYDVAATIVGVVERRDVLPRTDVKPGDALIGLPSTGLHTNGYSLARKALMERGGLRVSDRPGLLGGRTVGDALLAIHRSYAPLLLPILPERRIKAMAHITGGGFIENVPRVLPKDTRAVFDASAWTPLPIFDLIRDLGDVPDAECYRVFNMGMGMVLVTAREEVDALLRSLAARGEHGARVIGEISAGAGEPEAIVRFAR